MAAPGTRIADRYRLIEQLGAGGMGVVWEAEDERLHRAVAVKQLRIPAGATDAETEVGVQRAMREARISARLQHPYAVSVFDVVEHEHMPCLVMELVPSVPLSQAIRELGGLTPTEVARVGSQVAGALAAAHALGIVHRDVKPGNVLIGDDGTAKICDFGISRAFGDSTLTMTGMITGTPAYLAPEGARGEESTFASDVYSLGATLYAAVEGVPPCGSDGNAIAVLYRVAAGEVRAPERAGPLTAVLLEMLSLEPGQRPTMAEVAARLGALAGSVTSTRSEPPGAPIAPPSESSPPTSPTPILVPAVGPVRAPASPQKAPVGPTGASDGDRATDGPTVRTSAPARRRPALVVLVVAAVLAGIVAAILLWPDGSDPSAGADPSRSAPDSTSTSAGPTGAPTADELAAAVTDYYGLLPDDPEAAWELLTPAYQRQTGGWDSYEGFWKDIDTVTVSAVEGTTPNRVEADLAYVAKSGGRRSSERRSFQLVRSDGVLKINQSSVI